MGWKVSGDAWAPLCPAIHFSLPSPQNRPRHFTPLHTKQTTNERTHHPHLQALYDLMAAHCPDTCAIFKGTPEEVEENKLLFRQWGYYAYR